MSKIKLPFRLLHFVIVILCTQVSLRGNDLDFIGEHAVTEIVERINGMAEDFDFQFNADVYKYLNQYLVDQRYGAETVLGRSQIYFPLIESELTDRNLPDEIKYLAVIESSLKPTAVSKVGAVGMWQFMKATGRMYGLEIGGGIDERRDPEKATKAALEYLEDLYQRFDDWTLALAAYNCGPGNVSKAMRRSGKNTYWEIRSFLPRETRNYVPKFFAMAYVMEHHQAHGLRPRVPKNAGVLTRKAMIKETVPLQKISEKAEVSLKEIRKYNPVLVGRYIPKREGGFVLTLPSLPMYKFLNEMEMEHRLLPDLVQDVRFELEIYEIIYAERENISIHKIEKLKVAELNRSEDCAQMMKQKILNKFLFEGMVVAQSEAVEESAHKLPRRRHLISRKVYP